LLQMAVFFIIILLTDLIHLKTIQTGFGQFVLTFAKTLCWFYFLPLIGAIALRFILKGDKKMMSSILSLLSMVGIAVIISIITATGRESLLKVGPLLLITSLLHNLAGYSLGYGVSWISGMPEKDRRTVAFEVGMQNGGLASGLALQMGKVATVGLAPAVFGPLMNITASVLSSWWRTRNTDDIKNEPEVEGKTIPVNKEI
jgi:BASS family bile acid:Na+ symporter